jgi:hypothetical protein
MIINWVFYSMIVVSAILYVYSLWKAEKDEEATLNVSTESSR